MKNLFMGQKYSRTKKQKPLKLRNERANLNGDLNTYRFGSSADPLIPDPCRDYFQSLSRHIENAKRFRICYNVRNPDYPKETAFSSTHLNCRDFLGDLKFYVNKLELVIASAIDKKIVDKQFIEMIRKNPLLNGYLRGCITSGEDDLSEALRLYLSIGVMAWAKVQTYLGRYISDRAKESNLLASFYFDIYAYNDVELNKSRVQKHAQDALNWLMNNDEVFIICSGMLRPAVQAISDVCSPITEYPITHNPVINRASELKYIEDPMVRSVSLWSNTKLLGEKETLRYDPQEGQIMPTGEFTRYLRDISIEDLQQQLDIFQCNLNLIDINEVKGWFESAKDSMESEQLLLWTNRLEELEEVLTAQYYCYDQIHSVGLMNAEPNSTAEEIGQELIGKFLYLSRKVAEWIHDDKSIEHLRNASSTASTPVTAEILDKFLEVKVPEEKEEDIDEQINQLVHLLELSNDGDEIKCPAILMFLGGETTKRGSSEKRKMGEKVTDFTNPDYAKREEGEVYSFPCMAKKQPDPADIRKQINEDYPDLAVTYKGEIVENAHPYWKEFCLMFPPKSRKSVKSGKHIGYKLVGNAKKGAFSDDVAKWLFTYLPEDTAYHLKRELRKMKGKPLTKPNAPSNTSVSVASEIT
jgi:hypothetical protein